MENVVSVKNLVREYISTKGIIRKEKVVTRALNGISFEVKRGEVFGLLGPNGAGKTTTAKILTTLLAPTSGEVKVFGYNVFGEEKKLRPLINFIFGGERGIYWRLSARDNLIYFSDLYKVDSKIRDKRIPELLKLVGLSDRADEKVETYSKGMKQRLQIARGLVNDPDIIFLDEPTIGLDPIGARELRKIISDLSARGKTILLTTHYMYEADELCDRIAIIDKGTILALDTPSNLKKLCTDISVLEVSVKELDNQLIDKIRSIEEVDAVSTTMKEESHFIQIQCKNPTSIMEQTIAILVGCKILQVSTREATLEDAYIKLVGDKDEK